jgi:NADH-quinone oxidoreductase subunit K
MSDLVFFAVNNAIYGYVLLSVLLFCIGFLTIIIRKNVILQILGIELMLNACNLLFITFSKLHGDYLGQVVSMFVIVVAAGEVVAGLVLVLLLNKQNDQLNIDLLNKLKN